MPEKKHGPAPVTVVARFVLTDRHKEDTDAFAEAFDGYREYMTTQHGFWRTSLLRSPDHPDRHVIVTEWRDNSAYKAAVMVPDFLLLTAAGLMELADLVNDHGPVLASAPASEADAAGAVGEGVGQYCVVASHEPGDENPPAARLDAASRREGFVSGSVIASDRRKGGHVSLMRLRDAEAARAGAGPEGEIYEVIAEASMEGAASRAA
ncbi:antibiotic biosynthesis monooxygenase family protein [Streptomyces sp. ME19-01-6]|uniref:antibiotic biosynthesis monooxygenase family protein n=1 Tax=Streptomyces sp. ME19-01-6 TaxID=3028686 RepID=UPI0029B937A6|nr:antibiotic biosynthesis monooxygenase family protein [Streptomyces sp. ME19-01-6]MDX3229769.1 antibiotic biosynthesis monooxygenase [Streptomyces sp. ME19-01-6]